jgi:hypothetical protein
MPAVSIEIVAATELGALCIDALAFLHRADLDKRLAPLRANDVSTPGACYR